MSKKLICGVGINDADYVVQVRKTVGCINGKQKQKLVWICPFYRKWKDMMERCYSESYLFKHPTYKGCSVCEEWKRFSNFKRWMETQDWEGKQLDKDLLLPDNKVYSPDTCVFVNQSVNLFVVERGNSRGEWPLGVYSYKQNEKFIAQCSNPFTGKRENLGYFNDPQEAHKIWLTRKLELAKLLAAEQTDPRVAEALIKRYANYQTTEELKGLK